MLVGTLCRSLRYTAGHITPDAATVMLQSMCRFLMSDGGECPRLDIMGGTVVPENDRSDEGLKARRSATLGD